MTAAETADVPLALVDEGLVVSGLEEPLDEESDLDDAVESLDFVADNVSSALVVVGELCCPSVFDDGDDCACCCDCCCPAVVVGCVSCCCADVACAVVLPAVAMTCGVPKSHFSTLLSLQQSLVRPQQALPPLQTYTPSSPCGQTKLYQWPVFILPEVARLTRCASRWTTRTPALVCTTSSKDPLIIVVSRIVTESITQALKTLGTAHTGATGAARKMTGI